MEKGILGRGTEGARAPLRPTLGAGRKAFWAELQQMQEPGGRPTPGLGIKAFWAEVQQVQEPHSGPRWARGERHSGQRYSRCKSPAQAHAGRVEGRECA